MTKLSVNINKLATLRNARGGHVPNISQMTQKIIRWGAHGITLHPRPDERHIRRSDVFQLSFELRQLNASLKSPVEFNIEGYPSENFIQLIEETRPHQCTLVPDPPEALTSNAGWPLARNQRQLQTITQRLKDLGVRCSLFVDPMAWSPEESLALKEILPTRVEIYTESLARAFGSPQLSEVLNSYQSLARIAGDLGIGLNAGHDLNQHNLHSLIQAVPSIEEVSIGHALICEALYEGMEKTLQNYLRILGWVP